MPARKRPRHLSIVPIVRDAKRGKCREIMHTDTPPFVKRCSSDRLLGEDFCDEHHEAGKVSHLFNPNM